MSERDRCSAIPTAQEVNERWLQALAQFELWTKIWADNPELAKKSGSRVEELMLPRDVVQQRYASHW